MKILFIKSFVLIFLGLALNTSLYSQPLSPKLKGAIDQIVPRLLTTYRQLHQSPELSLREEKTSGILAEKLEDLGFRVTQKIGGFGLAGVMENGPGPVVLIRTDLDALPVKETTGLDYASKVFTTDAQGNEVPAMHACGHDMHMTVWLGVAELLAKNQKSWKGTLIMIGQPAEEIGEGARAMLEDNLYEVTGTPDYALALHMSPWLPAGSIGICPEYALATVDWATITVFGQGGHGAAPQKTTDPVVLASKIVLDLQTIVSRNVNPIHGAVVSVGKINGGTKGNVIPDEVSLELTMRSFRPEVQQLIRQRMVAICNGQAATAGLPEKKYPKIDFPEHITPAVYNHPEMVTRLRPVFEETLGKEAVETVEPVMIGEDFSRYSGKNHEIPALLFWLGATNAQEFARLKASGQDPPSLHSPNFAPDPEPALRTGIKAMGAAALSLFND